MSDVPEGYKMSEVGVIPEDWEVKKLGVIADVKTGPFGSSLHERDYVNDGTPIITVEHLGEQGVVHENLPMVSDFDRKRLNAYALQPDDIVFSRVGSVDRNSLIKEKESGWLFSGRLLRIRLTTKFIFPSYLSYYFHQEPTKQRIRSVAVGQTMASLNTEILKNIEVAIPPTIEEQQAIASALSDVDVLVTALEQLITKKRNIKKGAMQQLITGKKRLPGFVGEWGVKRLGEIAEIATGNTPPTNDLNNYGNDFLFVSPADLGRSKYIIDSDKKLSKKGFNISRKFPKNSILFTCIGSTIGKSGIAPIVLTSNQQINAIFPNDSYSTDYVFYTLNHLAYRIKSLASEQAVPIINKSTFEATQTPFPPLSEQQAIAQILSDMDTEIESLEQKQAKYKAIKQGMMQELLTGKRRLA